VLLKVLEAADKVLLRHILQAYQREMLLPIMEGYVTVLDRIRKKHIENHGITASTARGSVGQVRNLGKRVALDAGYIRDCRDKIIHYNLMLNTFMTSLNGCVAARLTFQIHHSN
jgi:hypothetical protein